MGHIDWRFRVLLFGIGLFAISGYYCFVETEYLVQGQSARAMVTSTKPTSDRRGRHARINRVEYRFAEPNGTQRSGSDHRPLDWTPPPNGRIVVEYTPGQDGRSRMAGSVNSRAILLFGGCLVVLAVFGIFLWSRTRETIRPREPELEEWQPDGEWKPAKASTLAEASVRHRNA